ncbi:hypothetical protein P153DRAFT_431873 [Dothidotthia symphoricarpi CBS 119687]|uniref:Sld7 C-terminal domain-containing protein n=1 Tax=Dothidotthia symphoricarpi CBS 119687 TaxID=1392245 RepID=A0A6A6AF80_9PLEO|nr:uncharacterized protein P153DRAFT_431873 [Dothidotthia symphoricarpi CBS 119687]KAF2129071.1 hypothetical protein P153DRAFT_431873 [Dothidotthia symphoricarpi CBS 119687]
MSDIWSGDILLPDGESIKNVGLALPASVSSPLSPTAILRFLTTVDTVQIPLYLAAGPSLDVWTSDEATEAWFHTILLSTPVSAGAGEATEWWTCPRSQSPVGILVQVDSEGAHTARPRVSEIVFYGTISAACHDQSQRIPELRVHALPLSSDRLYQHVIPELSHLSPADDVEVNAQFLTPPCELHKAPGSPKQKRDIFAEATMARRKARGTGGVAMAATAAVARQSESQGSYAHRKSLSIDSRASPFQDSRPPSAQGALSRPSSRPLSRSPSLSSDARPLSRKGPSDPQVKRSNLSHVATVPLQPEEPTTESKNKETLSRVVMAAMRMHGLQQRKKTVSRRASVGPGAEESWQSNDEPAAEEAKDEEYKLIYHQTYKGAAFALRKHILEKPLHAQPDRLRDVVEQLLTIFLHDPLAQLLPLSEPNSHVATPHRLGVPGSTHNNASPFDLPSGARPPIGRSVTDSMLFTGSPVSRKNHGVSATANGGRDAAPR